MKKEIVRKSKLKKFEFLIGILEKNCLNLKKSISTFMKGTFRLF